MEEKFLSPKSVIIGLGLATAGLAGYSFYRAKKLSTGKIVIDMTDNVPSFIRSYIHSRKWLPIVIDIQTLTDALRGVGTKKEKAQKILSELGKYISITVKE